MDNFCFSMYFLTSPNENPFLFLQERSKRGNKWDDQLCLTGEGGRATSPKISQNPSVWVSPFPSKRLAVKIAEVIISLEPQPLVCLSPLLKTKYFLDWAAWEKDRILFKSVTLKHLPQCMKQFEIVEYYTAVERRRDIFLLCYRTKKRPTANQRV